MKNFMYHIETFRNEFLDLDDGIYLDNSGNKFYVENNWLHRYDAPAIEFKYGGYEWREYGNLHRIGGPAVEKENGDQEWWVNGELHREDGPAIDCVDGYKEWLKDNKWHREDGPAIIQINGRLSWYLEDYCYETMDDWAKALGIFDTEDFVMLKLEYGS